MASSTRTIAQFDIDAYFVLRYFYAYAYYITTTAVDALLASASACVDPRSVLVSDSCVDDDEEGDDSVRRRR